MQAFSQDFESGSPNFMSAEGPHSMARGVWGHAPPENFEKLKPLRCDFHDSDSYWKAHAVALPLPHFRCHLHCHFH